MACALVPFGRLRDLGAARDFLCPQRRHGGAAGGGECGKGARGCPAEGREGGWQGQGGCLRLVAAVQGEVVQG